MKNLDETLAALREQQVKDVARSKIKIDKALQPRDQAVVPSRDQHKQDALNTEHTTRLRQQLSISTTQQLDAVLAAKINGELYLVDGHHRYRAYALERRQSIPTRTLEMTWETAVLVSKLVNLDGVKLSLHKQQASECAWQYLAAMTDRGRLQMPLGLSTRSMEGKFGVGRDTVSRMMRTMPTVVLRGYPDRACDSGTGWPKWKYARGNAQRDWQETLGADLLLQHQAEKLAKKLAKLLDNPAKDVIRQAIELLRQEINDETADALIGIYEDLSA